MNTNSDKFMVLSEQALSHAAGLSPEMSDNDSS